MVVLLVNCGPIACMPRQTVVRQHGDLRARGRAIPPQAYAHYARALLFERRGASQQAAREFRRALESDPNSGAAWAGLIRIVCRDSHQSARSLLERSLRSADRPALALVSWGRCRLDENPEEAEETAHRALSFEPQLPEAVSLLIDARQRQHRAASEPRSGDPAMTDQQLASFEALLRIDRELEEGRLDAARGAATGWISEGELALRAWLADVPDLAIEQTRFALLLDDRDADACLTALLLRGHAAARQSSACEAAPEPERLSDLGVLVLAARLAESSVDAARRLLSLRPLPASLASDPAARPTLAYLGSWGLAPAGAPGR